jgi:hypothetical protein
MRSSNPARIVSATVVFVLVSAYAGAGVAAAEEDGRRDRRGGGSWLPGAAGQWGWAPTVGCDDSSGHHDGTAAAGYGVKFAITQGSGIPGLFAKARTYWEQSGFHVGTVDLTISDPDLHARKDGYEVVLHIVKAGPIAYVEGTTPCLPEATR